MTVILQQTRIRPHVLTLPALSLAARYGPLSEKMLAWAGVATTASAVARARAIVGWFAAHAVHPHPPLHPDGTSANTGVLPVGETWETFNALFGPTERKNSDTAYWYALFPDGMAMLDALVGTVDSEGDIADDGMLEEYATNMWRIRDFDDFRSVQCTLQCKMAQVALAAQGIPAIDITTVGHDPMAFYDRDSGRWLYIDPTFGETLALDGVRLGPLDLLTLSLGGQADEIASEGLPGTAYLAQTYFEGERLPDGMDFMTVHTSPQWAGGLSARVPYAFGGLPHQSGGDDIDAPAEQLLPELGCGLRGFRVDGASVELRLATNWPDHAGYERSLDGGATWVSCGPIDYPSPGAGEIRYRSVDGEGWSGKVLIVSV